MTANQELQRVNEKIGLRGFTNLYHKENQSWWNTRKWWINAILWAVLLGGLTAIMLFAPGEEVADATEAEIAQSGGLLAYIQSLGLSVFFEFGIPVLAIGTVIFSQDLIIGEKQSGAAEWLLSKPVTRQAYILSKIAASAPPLLILLVGLPSILVYGLLSIRMAGLFPLLPFLTAVGLMALHTIFYLSLTLMLGTFFNNRIAILGIALGSVLGGGIIGGLLNLLLYVTPWMLPKVAWLIATSQEVPPVAGIAPIAATILWIGLFIYFALMKIEKMEF